MTERWFEPTDGLAFVVRLLNSWDELEADPELLRDPEIAVRFLERHGLDAARPVEESELVVLRTLRTRLRRCWDAETDEAAVELLNDLLSEVRLQPRLVRDGAGAWAYRWDAPGLAVSTFAPGLAATALLDEIRVHGRRRLGSCAAGPCRCVYVDRSRSRTRRYCCEQCADRANQAAHRRRIREGLR